MSHYPVEGYEISIIKLIALCIKMTAFRSLGDLIKNRVIYIKRKIYVTTLHNLAQNQIYFTTLRPKVPGGNMIHTIDSFRFCQKEPQYGYLQLLQFFNHFK